MKVTRHQSSIFERFIKGDQYAFEQIHRLYSLDILYFVKSLVTYEEEVQDIVAESFCKAFVAHETFHDLEHIKRFLFTVARNQAIDLLRSKAKEKVTKQELLYLTDEGEYFIDRERITAKYLSILHEEVENLPEQMKRVIKLILSAKTTKEIASNLGLSPQTVLNYKQAALRALKIRFGETESIVLYILLLLSRHDSEQHAQTSRNAG